MPVDAADADLEPIMIRKAMLLVYCGPDLALCSYSSCLKLWVMGAVIVDIAKPYHWGNVWLDIGVFLAGMVCFAIVVGVVEARFARPRLRNVTHYLAAAMVVAVLALIMAARNL